MLVLRIYVKYILISGILSDFCYHYTWYVSLRFMYTSVRRAVEVGYIKYVKCTSAFSTIFPRQKFEFTTNIVYCQRIDYMALMYILHVYNYIWSKAPPPSTGEKPPTPPPPGGNPPSPILGETLLVGSSYVASINAVSSKSNYDVKITSNFQRNFYFIDTYIYEAKKTRSQVCLACKDGGFTQGGGVGLFADGRGSICHRTIAHKCIVIQNYMKHVTYTTFYVYNKCST